MKFVSAFVDSWRTSLDRSVLADAQGLLNMARAALDVNDMEAAGRLVLLRYKRA